MPRTVAALILALALLFSLSASAQEPPLMAGYEEQDTFRDWSDNMFFKRMQDRTGQAFRYQQAQAWEAWQKAKDDIEAGTAELPQVLFKAGLTPAETMEWLDRGLLMDLAPMLELSAPNLWALLQQYPDVRAAITLPDGRIGALPYINLEPTQNYLWLNQAWLTALKLDLPESPAELADVLQAFLTKDPNRNGRRDEVPLTFIGPYDLKYLAQGFGLAANDFNMFNRDGQAVFMPGEPAFRDFVRWLNDLWQRGLLDRNGFYTSDTLRQVTDAKAERVYGAFLAPLPSSFLPADWAQDYVVVEPFAYEGKRVWRSVTGRATPGAFALTSACENPQQMLQWVDYLYTLEGATLATNGLEGVDYLVDGDGSWRMTDIAQQQGFLAQSTISTGAVPPGVSNQAFQARSSQPLVRYVLKEMDKANKYVVDPFPPFSLTTAQEEEVAPLQLDIGCFVDQSIARFVIGEWGTTDAQFEAFDQRLKQLDTRAFTAFWQDVLSNQAKEK